MRREAVKEDNTDTAPVRVSSSPLKKIKTQEIPVP